MSNRPIMNMEQFANELCKLVDQLSKNKYPFGSPIYEFQQGLISATKIYRKRKEEMNKMNTIKEK